MDSKVDFSKVGHRNRLPVAADLHEKRHPEFHANKPAVEIVVILIAIGNSSETDRVKMDTTVLPALCEAFCNILKSMRHNSRKNIQNLDNARKKRKNIRMA